LTAPLRRAYGANRLPSRFPIPPGFWKGHLGEHPLDAPAAARRPFPEQLVGPEEIFDALVAASDADRAGSPCALRLYLGDRELVRRQTVDGLGSAYWEILPRRGDGTLSRYAERVREHHGYECFALLLNESQSVLPEIWFRVRDFLCGLYEEGGFPAGGADANIFAGNYRRTPFGVHTDDRDVFTWIVEGRKKFLVWPRDALEGVFGPGRRDPLDYADFRATGIPLEGDAGDLLYWPHPYWHVAESDQEGLVSTLSVGLEPALPAESWMKEALLDLVRGSVESANPVTHHEFRSTDLARSIKALPPALTGALRAHRRRSVNRELERELRLRWMCWLTGYGMKLPPRAPAVELDDGDRLRCDAPYPIACAPWRDEALCAANGHGFAVPRCRELTAFVRELNSTRELSVADLRRRFSRALTRSRLDAMLEAFVSFRALQRFPVEK
jgi:50S ribosomal protein L16 3-hydroxylase